jgi:hypothetical protein
MHDTAPTWSIAVFANLLPMVIPTDDIQNAVNQKVRLAESFLASPDAIVVKRTTSALVTLSFTDSDPLSSRFASGAWLWSFSV